MNISFIKLLEAVIRPENVDFVDTIINKNINSLLNTDNTNKLVSMLAFLFRNVKLLDGVKITFLILNKGTESDQWDSVGVVGGDSTLDGIIKIYCQPDIHKKWTEQDKEYIRKNSIEVFKEIINHELIHQKQFEMILRKYINDPEKIIKIFSKYDKKKVKKNAGKYLEDKLEIMAFAKTAVDEFHNKKFSKEDIINYVKRYTDADPNDSLVFYAYVDWFGDKKDNKVLRKFLKNVVDYAH